MTHNAELRDFIRATPGCNAADARELKIGTAVRLKDAYYDEACTIPISGTVEDILDYGGLNRFVVMFNRDEPLLPPGGEFSVDQLVLVG
jgi:hypothetical protein